MGGRIDDVATVPAPTATATPIVVAASVAGAAHARTETPCQDAYAWAPLPDGVAIAVADGLGSAPAADRGARIAAEAAVASVGHGPLLEEVLACVAGARLALEADGAPLRELACTLIVACARGGEIAVAHIGDGGAVGLVDEGPVMLSGPAREEYVDVVDPLTADDWGERVRVSAAVGVRALALFTDGCERAAIAPDGEAHAGFFDPLFAFALEGGDAEELAALLAGPKMSEHSDDDKTLVLAWLPPQAS